MFDRPLRQPDERSCGSAVLVAARMLRDASYADRAAPRFAEASLAMHRRITRPVDVLGRVQVPWPRAIGTPPWAVARQLSWTFDTPYTVRLIRWSAHARRRAVRALETSTAAGLPAGLFVGNERLPRHVTLVVGPGLATYEPAVGHVVPVRADDLVNGNLSLGGWKMPWFVIVPRETLP